MLLVADANVLFSFFKPDSATRKLLASPDLELASPMFALAELDKYMLLILEKSKIDESVYRLSMELLKEFVDFIPLAVFEDFIVEAKRVCPKPEDIQYFALSMKLGCPLWSNEVALKRQSSIRVLSTAEVVSLL